MKMRIIKDILNMIEQDKNIGLIDAKTLMSEEDEYEDEFIHVLKVMEIEGYIITYKPSSKRMPEVKLTPKGAFYGKEYIKDYDKIFNEVTSLIAKDSKQFNNNTTISRELNIPLIYVGAVLNDLEKQKYITLKQMASGLFFKFTDRGREYFF